MPRQRLQQGHEDARERVAAALQTLEQGIDSILTSESFAHYLRTMARFHSYSASNVALILMQRPDASRVAGYRRWQDLGRQVNKGEKGIHILVPHKRRITAEKEEDEATVVLSGFGVGSVFDISQTTGDPIAEPPPVQVVDGASDVGMRLYVDLLDYLTEHHGVTTAREDTRPANGYFDPILRRVAIGCHIDGDQATKTLCHETAHVVAGHTVGMSNPEVETVAESAAFVSLNYYGIDSSGYTFPYVARWAQDRTVLRANLQAIQQVAHEVLGTLENSPGRGAEGHPSARSSLSL